MELRHLRYFVAVAEELNFSRAAARLHLAQPSLSKQIRDLEDDIGVRLFDRDRNHVALSDAGRIFLSDARELLLHAAAAAKRAQEGALGRMGELRIATIGPLALTFLPTSLSRFRQQFPEVVLTVRDIPAVEQMRQILDGSVHVGFIPVPLSASSDDPRFQTRRLLRSPVVVVLNPEHPLAAKDPVPLRELAGETFLHIRLNQVEGQRLWTESICRKAGFTPKFGAGAESPDNLLSMIAAGQGLAIVPKFSERPPSPGYVFRPVAEENAVFELIAIWKRDSSSTLLKNFLKIVIAEGETVQRSLQSRPKRTAKARR